METISHSPFLEMQRLRWAVDAYARCMSALTHAPNFQMLASEVCHSITNDIYVLAWIGLTENKPGKPVRIIGRAGGAIEYLDGLKLAWAENLAEGQGPTGIAIRTGLSQVTRNTSEDARFAPWRTRAKKHGIKSSITIPIWDEGQVAGALMVYASQIEAFGPDERALFERLAGEVSYAMSSFRSKELLQITEAKYAKLIAATPTPIVSVGMDGRIQLFNNAAESVFGYAASEVLGGSLDCLIPEYARARHRDHVAKFGMPGLQGGRISAIREAMGRKKDGSVFPVEVIISRADLDGGPHLTAIIRDLTEEKNLQARLIHSEKMDAVGQMSGGLSHDFNNLIGIIRANAEAIRDSADIPAEALSHLAAIDTACAQASELTSRLLLFARTAATRPEIIDVNAVLRDLALMLERILDKAIRIEIVEQPGAAIAGDRAQLHTALLNLAFNARDAMPGGGRLKIAVARENHVPDGRVLLTVEDSGIGMTDQVARKALEPFFTTKPAGKGTGLGLAMVERFVKQFDGSVRVESEPGRGTKVTLAFPPAASALPAPADKKDHAGSLKGMTILYVEDNEDLRDVTAMQMRRLGAQVVAMRSSADAVDFAHGGGRFDILIADQQLGDGFTGIELARRLQDGIPQIGVVITSGYVDDALRAQLEDGWRMLPKPASRGELLSALQDLARA